MTSESEYSFLGAACTVAEAFIAEVAVVSAFAIEDLDTVVLAIEVAGRERK